MKTLSDTESLATTIQEYLEMRRTRTYEALDADDLQYLDNLEQALVVAQIPRKWLLHEFEQWCLRYARKRIREGTLWPAEKNKSA
jgi:hypothetical protein